MQSYCIFIIFLIIIAKGTFGYNVQQIIFSKDGHTWSFATWPGHSPIKMQSISPLPWIWVTPVTALTEYSGNDAEPVPGLALNRPGSLNGLKNEMTCEETAEGPWSTGASDTWIKKPRWKWMVQPQPPSFHNMDQRWTFQPRPFQTPDPQIMSKIKWLF